MHLWWAMPNVLAGMAMPYIHVERRMNRSGALREFADELPELWDIGIRAIVCLLNLSSDEAVYRTAGFDFRCVPIPDGGAPTIQQFLGFVDFVDQCHSAQKPVAVHCQAGCGRTGTMLAGYLVARGQTPAQAIAQVRSAEPLAIETPLQFRFIESIPQTLGLH